MISERAPSMVIGPPDRSTYPVAFDGQSRRLPRLTSRLNAVTAKPWLAPWAAKVEREYIVRASWRAIDLLGANVVGYPFNDWDKLVNGLAGDAKAHATAADAAKDIGTATHEWVKWESRRRLGLDPGPEPQRSDDALTACMAWEDWARAYAYEPLLCEFPVAHWALGYAGTLDALGWITLGGDVSRRLLVVLDYKTSKQLDWSAFVQAYGYNVALNAMPADAVPAQVRRMEPNGVCVVRLPKTLDNLTIETAVIMAGTPLWSRLGTLFNAAMTFAGALETWDAKEVIA